MFLLQKPRQRRFDRAFCISLLLSLLLHAGAVGVVILVKPRHIEIQLQLQSGEEAMAVDIGGAVESAASAASREIPEAKFAEAAPPPPPDEKEFPEGDPPPPAASNLRGDIALDHDRPQERIETRPGPERALTDLPRRRYHRAGEEPETPEPEALAREPEPAEQAETAMPSPASEASVASVIGAEARPRGVVQRARPLGALVPEYPHGARRRGEEGEVLVRAAIDASGRCVDAAVERSSGWGDLDRAAVDTVRRASFAPASEDGLPIAMVDRFIIEFQLR